MKYFLVLIALVALKCGQSTKNIVYQKDSVKLKQDFLPGVSGPAPEQTMLDKIQGVWTDGSDVNANFLIKGDTIVFIEQGPHKYQLKGDSMKIFYEDSITSVKVLFKEDTLVMHDGGEESAKKYWRFRD